ncbi:Phosphoglycolate phosphatase [subsurface metagenome]
MSIKAIIFDLDGTLIDSIPDIADAANQLLVNHNFPVHDPSCYAEWIGNGALKLIRRAVPGNANEAFLRELLDEYLGIHIRNCTNKTRLYEGIDQLLSDLNEQNISISILTNKPHSLTLKVFDHYLSQWKFDFVLGQMPGYPKKPDPARAIEIAEKLNCKPREMLFIGDSDTDIKTGITAGMIPVGVTWGYDTEFSIVDAGAKYLMNDVKELMFFFKSKNVCNRKQ